MISKKLEVLQLVLKELHDTRYALCVDGESSFQRGFFMGYECAQRVVESATASLRVKS